MTEQAVNGRTIAVIGNGIIGHGIAEIFANSGWQVRLVGRSKASLEGAIGKIAASLEAFHQHGLVTPKQRAAALNRITLTTDLDDAAAAELVIEAVPEDMELKREIFHHLDTMCDEGAILATSSGHLVSEIVGRVHGRGRVVATHFWYPPQLIPLVEVCGGPETQLDIVPRVCQILREVGKEPVVIDKEIAGFIGNRIQFAALREAWSLWAAGVASAEAIDAVVRNSIGRRLGITGPIESADAGGLDTMHAFACFLQPDLDASKLPPELVKQLVAKGNRGLPSGRGIYDWSKRDGPALLEARREELFRWLKADREGNGS